MGTIRYARLHEGDGLVLGDCICRARAGCHVDEGPPRRDQLVFVREGLFLVDVAGQTLVGSPNHVLFLRCGEEYRVRHPLGRGDECTVIELDADASEDVERVVATLRVCRARPSAPRPFLRQRRLVEALRRRAPVARLAVDEAIESLLGDLVDERVAHEDRQPGALTARAHRHCVEAVISFLGSRPGANPSLAELARHAGVSAFHLARMFRRETGWTLHRYQRSLRLRAALGRLAGGERDLTRLALELGFADHSHFTNAFRSEFGVAPSDFRRAANEG